MNQELLFRHKFEKKGRTISLNTNLGTNGATGDAGQTSFLSFFAKDPITETRIQQSDLKKSGLSLQNNVIYTEPIGNKGMLSLTYSWNTSTRRYSESFLSQYA
jgi:hypothetical protein